MADKDPTLANMLNMPAPVIGLVMDTRPRLNKYGG